MSGPNLRTLSPEQLEASRDLSHELYDVISKHVKPREGKDGGAIALTAATYLLFGLVRQIFRVEGQRLWQGTYSIMFTLQSTYGFSLKGKSDG